MPWQIIPFAVRRATQIGRLPAPKTHRAPSAHPQLRQRIVTLSIALVLGIAIADWQIIVMQRASAINDFATAARNLAFGFSKQTRHAYMATDAVLRDYEKARAAHPDLPGGHIATSPRAAGVPTDAQDSLVQGLPSLPGINSLAIFDAGSRIVAATSAGAPEAQDLLKQDFLQQLARAGPGAVFVGPPQRNKTTGQWTSLLARRIDGQYGGFGGVLLADMSLAGIEEIYRLGAPPRRRLTLLRTDGTLLVRYPPEPGLIGRKVPDGDPWYGAATGGAAYVAPGYFDAKLVLNDVRPVAGLPLLVEASIQLDEVLARWKRERIWVIAGGIAVSALAVLLVRLFGLQLQRLALRNAQLDEARGQLDVAISNISQGICFFDGEQQLIVCNRRFRDIYGLDELHTRPGVAMAELVDHWFAAGGPANVSRQEYLVARDAIVRSGKPHQSIVELADGRTVAIQQQPMPDGGWVATHEDITARREAEKQISFLARHDVLTSLPNRAMLMERIEQARSGAGRGRGFAVLFLDLDRFKAVNDTLGHAAGDTLLQAVATRLRETVRESDTVARLGGDEFVILQDDVQTPESAAVLAKRIIAAVAAPYTIGVNEVVIGVSIGIDIAIADRVSAGTILKNADMALYISKAEGRGMFRFFEPDMDAKIQARHALERDLRCALERHEFVLYYQAIVNARTGRPHGFEALLRWNHPVRGIVPPNDFIPVAEETGLIIQIGEWVVRQACADAAGWPADVHVSVNLSPIQFRSANLVAVVHEALAAAGLPASRLELEITESILLQGNERNLAVMHEFRAAGIGIVMDDFGVGYSSLSTLRQFPFQRIKIDRCFVQDLGIRRDAISVVRATLGLCRDLEIGVVAEGVETGDQMTMLLAEGCTHMQGYLFSRPRPIELLVGGPEIALAG